MESDNIALDYFNKFNVDYELFELKEAKQIIQAYAESSLVIGMRGHSQLIPFGCNTPILSIITHDKMTWFLEDINHTELGVDILNPDFETILKEKALYIYRNKEKYIEELSIEQNNLWATTQTNLKRIQSLVGNDERT